MTASMYQELVDSLVSKNKKLKIGLIVVSVICALLLVFSLSSFEISYESYEDSGSDYDVDQSVEIGEGNNGDIIQDSDVDTTTNSELTTAIALACITALVMCAIIVGGIVIYGKNKCKNSCACHKEENKSH